MAQATAGASSGQDEATSPDRKTERAQERAAAKAEREAAAAEAKQQKAAQKAEAKRQKDAAREARAQQRAAAQASRAQARAAAKDRRAARAEELRAERKDRALHRWRLPAQYRSVLFPLLVAVFVLVAALISASPVGRDLPLGVGLAGGLELTLSPAPADGADEAAQATEAQLSMSADVLRRRFAARGVSDYDVRTNPEQNAIVATLRTSGDLTRASAVAERVGAFELVELDRISSAESLAQLRAGADGVLLAPGSYAALLTGADVTGAEAVAEEAQDGSAPASAVINLTFGDEGRQVFTEVTHRLAASGGQIAFVVDRVVLSAPRVTQTLPEGRVSISGDFTQEQAETLAAIIKGGELPLALKSEGARPVGATLGSAVGTGLAVAVALVVGGLVVLAVRTRLSALPVLAGLLSYVVLMLGALTALGRAQLVVVLPMGAVLIALGLLVLEASAVLRIGRARLMASEGMSVSHAVERAWSRAWLPYLGIGAGLVVVSLATRAAEGSAVAASLLMTCAAILLSCALVQGLVVAPLMRLAALSAAAARPQAWGLAAPSRAAESTTASPASATPASATPASATKGR